MNTDFHVEARLNNFLPLFLAAVVLFCALGAVAEATNALSDAEIQGRQLAQQLCEAKPEQNFTNLGVLKIRTGAGKQLQASLKVETVACANGWKNNYAAELPASKDLFKYTLTIVHATGTPTAYQTVEQNFAGRFDKKFAPDLTAVSFAGSDFWLCDLGLEFFHWPAQKVLPNPTTLKRGHDFTLLESTNPNPPPNGYSRVLSWIDKETGGILYAEAYDASGKLLKEFEPKSFKKINGQWELQEMEIRNVQTRSRTRLEFDLKQP